MTAVVVLRLKKRIQVKAEIKSIGLILGKILIIGICILAVVVIMNNTIANRTTGLSTGSDIECQEKWICGDWTPCIEGTRWRACWDANACGTEKLKPAQEQICYMPTGQIVSPLASANPVFGLLAIGLLGLIALRYLYYSRKTKKYTDSMSDIQESDAQAGVSEKSEKENVFSKIYTKLSGLKTSLKTRLQRKPKTQEFEMSELLTEKSDMEPDIGQIIQEIEIEKFEESRRVARAAEDRKAKERAKAIALLRQKLGLPTTPAKKIKKTKIKKKRKRNRK
jgi:hypothetical protein